MEPDWREVLSEKNGVIRELTAQLSAITAERDNLKAEVEKFKCLADMEAKISQDYYDVIRSSFTFSTLPGKRISPSDLGIIIKQLFSMMASPSKGFVESEGYHSMRAKIAALEKARAEFLDLSIRLAEEGMRLEKKIAALEKERDDLTQRLDSKIEALIHANDHCPEVDKKLALRDRQLELARKGLTRGCHCRPGGSICECCFCLAALEKTAGTEGGVCPNCQ